MQQVVHKIGFFQEAQVTFERVLQQGRPAFFDTSIAYCSGSHRWHVTDIKLWWRGNFIHRSSTSPSIEQVASSYVHPGNQGETSPFSGSGRHSTIVDDVTSERSPARCSDWVARRTTWRRKGSVRPENTRRVFWSAALQRFGDCISAEQVFQRVLRTSGKQTACVI